MTPASARLATGELVPIRTGELEEHIVGDVAWAAACYLAWTGDEAFAAAPAETSSSRPPATGRRACASAADGRAHIYGVIGPDEYHEPVDDNAFTNVLARWNLRQAAALAGRRRGASERSWLAIAEALVDGYDRASGIYEQFAGFFELEPLVIEEIAPRRPIAADLLLGAERTAGAQVLKQADVLMLHHLLPDEVAPGSLVPNLDFYEPRTAHGSSLSPAIHASAARPRRPLPAGARRAARSRPGIDLDDLTGTTAGGCTWRRWAACGRRSRSGSAASAHAARRCSSIRGCRRSGTRSSSHCASAGGQLRLRIDRSGGHRQRRPTGRSSRQTSTGR